MKAFADRYRGRRVLVTGHTGFKGSWLCEWLLALGAEVTGLALDPNTQPALFGQLELTGRLEDHRGDVRDPETVWKCVQRINPEFVFHLAAQPLVRLSYERPVETYATNVMGTVHLLDAVRRLGKPCVVVVVTTDKCYENKEWVHSYREEDSMGGHDPYSSSKGAAELVVSAYRKSYFSQPESTVRLASARAGNVIGGGDWALDRIVPDCIRSLRRGESIPVRNKIATRPWQHVLEPLSGYLWLGACLDNPDLCLMSMAANEKVSTLASGFNFGPNLSSNQTVARLVQEVLKHWPGSWDDRSHPNAVHEATRLNLAIDKAYHTLGWAPVWSFEETVAQTVRWYRNAESAPLEIRSYTESEISTYIDAAKTARVLWAVTS